MDIKLSDHFNYKRIFFFVLPPISSMIFTSLYSIVDGFFVSNYVGSTAFASINLVLPFIMLLSGIGFMFGSGGSALVALQLGQKKNERANRYFSMIVYTTIIVGVVLGALGYLIAPFVVRILGATEAMMPFCIQYLRISMLGVPFFMIQQLFQTFLITAERPKLGFRITLIAGCSNMVLDWLLVGLLKCGLAGAAWATILSQMIGGFIPLALFVVNKNLIVHLVRTHIELHVILKSSSNGLSEFLSNISMSVVGFLYNLQLLKYAGENGVSAYGVIMYVSFIFVAIYIGYTMGISPLVSYNHGARNTDELKSLYGKSLNILFITNIAMFLLAELSSGLLTGLFVGYDAVLFALTMRGLRIYSLAFLLMGFNIFSSALFTAFNNGVISAIISVSRTLVLELIMMYLLPVLWGIDGLWSVVIAVEGMGFILTVFFLKKYSKQYGYR